MPIHKEQRSLKYSPQQLFELVARVELYPEFLPLWQEVRVSQYHMNESQSSVYVTDQRIQLGPLYKSFRTQTTLIPYSHIHVISSDPMFDKFAIDWLFEAENNEECKIQFSLNCMASSILLRPVFDIALYEAAKSIITAFENRARSIYDQVNK